MVDRALLSHPFPGSSVKEEIKNKGIGLLKKVGGSCHILSPLSNKAALAVREARNVAFILITRFSAGKFFF